jgi:hypothetical protein
MKDIFLSYKKLDAERVRVLVEALERSGFTVWWDRTIPAGASWAQVIEEAITGCRCVVVVWSENSVAAEWVHKEARKGEQRGNLIPAMIDPVQPPFEFEHVQAANLVGWDGVTSHDQYEQLVARIEEVIKTQPGDEAGAALEEVEERRVSRARGRTLRRALAAVAVAVSIAAATAAVLWPSGSVELELENLKLSGVRFDVSAEERGSSSSIQVLQDVIPLRELIAFGLKQVDVPSSAEVGGRSYSDDPAIELVTLTAASNIDFTELELAAGAQLELRETIAGLQMSVRGASEWLAVSLLGPVLVTVEESEALDFERPGSVRLLPDPDGLVLEFQTASGELPPLFRNLAIDDLRLYRVDQDVDLEATSVDLVSTIEGGTLKGDGLGERQLSAGEGIRFDAFRGVIESLRLVGDTILLNAKGRSLGLRSGLSGEGKSEMPTRLATLGLTGKLLAALAALVYAAGLVVLTRRLWRQTI